MSRSARTISPPFSRSSLYFPFKSFIYFYFKRLWRLTSCSAPATNLWSLPLQLCVCLCGQGEGIICHLFLKKKVLEKQAGWGNSTSVFVQHTHTYARKSSKLHHVTWAFLQHDILLPHGFNLLSGPVVLWNISHRRCQLCFLSWSSIYGLFWNKTKWKNRGGGKERATYVV